MGGGDITSVDVTVVGVIGEKASRVRGGADGDLVVVSEVPGAGVKVVV
jgi:thiamine monophosphate kinase